MLLFYWKVIALKNVIDKYNNIIRELFVIMGAALVYMIICHSWIIAALWGIVICGAYVGVKKQIKNIEESIL